MASTAAELIPQGAGLSELRRVAAGCTACDLHKLGTQTVFGEGTSGADVMFVGEQPGDKEDVTGRPFVGPAGRLLDATLEEVGIDRTKVYVTNVVKHFKWEPRGKRRIHKKPNAAEIAACKPWLEAEIERVDPHVVVALGATAAQTLLGREFRVSEQRGRIIERPPGGRLVIATVHPSSILRSPDETRAAELGEFTRDLGLVAKELEG
ncbi:MAG: UdgX family uracil-DNA binding protein [Actinomycetota bacterium]|nr:UdgX family uracil-DNA binding protein [Actinomycetota bacterium]